MTLPATAGSASVSGSGSSKAAADFFVVAGSYERLLYGLDGFPYQPAQAAAKAADASHVLEPAFIFPAHIGSIKALAASRRFLASGSSDEMVRTYDLVHRREIGTLMHHSGTVTALAFFQDTHLLTAAEDGTIAVVRTRDWEPLHTLAGHRGAVRTIAVHPSGRLLLSAADDGFLKTWDLTKGNCAYTLRLAAPAARVGWSPGGGEYYFVMHDRELLVYATASGHAAGPAARPRQPRARFTAAAFVLVPAPATAATTIAAGQPAPAVAAAVAVGADDGSIAVHAPDGTCLWRWTAHASRVKDVAAATSGAAASSLLATCSTDGSIKVWDLSRLGDYAAAGPGDNGDAADTTAAQPPTEIAVAPCAAYEAGCRLTCLSIVHTAAAPDEQNGRGTGGGSGGKDSLLKAPGAAREGSSGQAGKAERRPASASTSEGNSGESVPGGGPASEVPAESAQQAAAATVAGGAGRRKRKRQAAAEVGKRATAAEASTATMTDGGFSGGKKGRRRMK